ncbi:MAG: GYD domain-containing protein [Gammaproteobacteria bacterium]|jgi:uncharacterized protein with GYD domain
MALYIHLVTMTEQGAVNLMQQPEGYAQYADFVQSVGGEIVSAVACLGQFDYLVVADYPDPDAALKASAYVAERGLMRAQTLPAWPIEDFYNAIG